MDGNEETTPAVPGLADFKKDAAEAGAGRSRRSLFRSLRRSAVGVLGVFESMSADGHADVRLDSTGEVVRARLDMFPDTFELEPGDELGVVTTDGRAQVIPHVRHTVRRTSRVEFWTINRVSGELRLLARRDLTAPDPSGDG